jgi:pimeloyl-ACP methyl ester carboxylesterase
MDRFEFEDVELSYAIGDGGEAVVFVHAAPFVSWYDPLLDELPGFATLTYRRLLRKPDDGPYRPLTVAEDAAICTRLLDHVGWTRAHVVGHSYGCLVALQLALDVPDRVASVALLEPAARGISSSAQVAAALPPIFAAYGSGDVEGAVDRFLRHVCGDSYRIDLDRGVPGAFDEALAHADLFFQAEMAAVRDWSFGADDAERVTQPVLNVLGADSAPRFVEAAELVQSWFPHAERLDVPGANHLLMVQNPGAVGAGLREFFSRHPISAEHTELVDR